MASVATVSGLTHGCASLCVAQNVTASRATFRPAALSKCKLLRPCLSSAKTLGGVPLVSATFFPARGKPSHSNAATVAAVAEGEIAVEEVEAALEEELAPAEDAETSEEATAATAVEGDAKPAVRRPFKNRRKITVKLEDMQPGQILPGKVRSIQSYGCFVDVGAFTDGLIHISEMADQFVENVGDLVEVGQDLQVRILEVDAAKGRISLSMRTPREERPEPAEGAAAPRAERGAQRGPQRGDQRPRRAQAGGRGGSDKPTHGIRKGQKFEGTVTNIAAFGAFLQLKEGVEGLLHASEIGEGSARVEVSEHLALGQKVNVTVLSVTKDRISLTTKEKVDTDDINVRLNQGADAGTDGITNPFEAAFKKSNLALDSLPGAEELAKTKKPEPEAASTDEIKTETQEIKTGGLFGDQVAETQPMIAEQAQAEPELETAEPKIPEPETPLPESPVAAVQEQAKDVVQDGKDAAQAVSEGVAPIADEVGDVAGDIAQDGKNAAQAVSEGVAPIADEVGDVAENVAEDGKDAAQAVSEGVEPIADEVTDAVTEAAEPVTSQVAPVVENVRESASEAAEPVINQLGQVVDVAQPVVDNVKKAAEPVIDTVQDVAEPAVDAAENQIGQVVDIAEPVVDSVKEVAQPVVDKAEDVVDSVKETVAPAAEKAKEETPAVKDAAPAAKEPKNENPSLAEQVKDAADEGVAAASKLADQVTEAVAEVAKGGEEEKPKEVEAKKEEPKAAGGISAAQVKILRDETGSGMMDCKKALGEAGGDIDKARDILRKKGLASADKKATRVAAEGAIGSYIHDSRIGVLVEVNCETDFVSRGDAFKELLEDMAMQVAACPQVEFVSVDEVPADVVAKEREIEAGKEDLASKPEAIREKMVDGRINKRLGELALLEQPYIRDDKLKVKDVLKQTVAKIGENIQIRRFERFNLGEGLQKKTNNLAAEVAEQTQKKEAAPAEPKKEEAAPSAEDAKPAVTVSAAAVKELRGETGAGMMDCKKALAECDNDVEKARELLRKKGLASAEKKAARLAAEGAVGSYIHDARIGVLVEVNCETDFVARGEKFKDLLEDIAMQVAACPQVTVVSPDDVPADVIAKEREIELGKEDLASKPEQMREKIVDGRMAKRVNELALLEQPYIRDDKQKLKDVIKAAVAAVGENIQVRRFVRYNLGEGIEKKSVDFAAEVAAQTGKA